jgi:alkaline phosphatase
VRQGGDCGTRNPEERMAAEPKDRRQEALVPAPSETHSGEDVAAFAGGPGSALVRGPMDQPELFHVMARALGFTWEPVSTAEADNEAG